MMYDWTSGPQVFSWIINKSARVLCLLVGLCSVIVRMRYMLHRVHLDGIHPFERVCLTVGVLFRTYEAVQLIVETLWRLGCSYQRPVGERLVDRPKALHGPDLPLVDVIITTCHEPLSVVLDTVRAACRMEYSITRYRVIVADDGKNTQLRLRVAALRNAGYSNLHYYAREKPILQELNPKSCNINSALQFAVPDEPLRRRPEWIAVLDCDMIPEPDFLAVLLEHASNDDGIAMAVCPQNFYNLPANDLLYQSLEVQNKVDEPLRSSIGGTWCTGSGFLVRKAALDMIGGMPNVSLCEDTACSFRLNEHGWRVVYVDRPLQWGLMPDSMAAHVAQRRRWAVGTVQNARYLRYCLTKKTRGMSTRQRLMGLSYCSSPALHCVIQPLTLLLTPWVHAVVTRPDYTTLWWHFFWNLMDHLASWNNYRVESVLAPSHYLHSRDYGITWLRSIVSTSVLAELLSLWKFTSINRSRFISTGSITSPLSERNGNRRAALRRRLATVLFGQEYRNNTIQVANALAAFITLVWMDVHSGNHGEKHQKRETIWVTLLSHSLSPLLGWECYLSFFIPIVYILWPTTCPSRRKLMLVDQENTWRPKPEFKRVRTDRWVIGQKLPAVIGTCWAVIALLVINDLAVRDTS